MDYKKIRSALRRKGFVPQEGSSHEKYRYYDPDGNKTEIHTTISRASGGETPKKPMQSAMARQLKISNDQFRSFVNCEIDQEEFNDIVSKKLGWLRVSSR